MSMDVKINDDSLQTMLRELIARMGNLKPVMNSIGEDIVESVLSNFEAGGRPTKWLDLANSTIRQRMRENKWPGMILARKGMAGGLMGSIHHTPFPNKVYAPVHQFGAAKGSFGTQEVVVRGHTRYTKYGKVEARTHTRRQILPWGDIPARPSLMVQDEDWTTIRDTLTHYIFKPA
uniref:Phage virion morphogenesis protein n=1 Tax=Desulfatirhabdium butyrativorans TaxID=340467 RepID=A0A7C4RQV6_9BACT